MTSFPRPWWMRAETHMLSLYAKGLSLYLVAFQESKDWTLWRGTQWRRTSGHLWHLWRISDTTYRHALWMMSSYTPSEAFSEVLNRRSMTALRSTKLKRIFGQFSLSGWRTLFGLAVLSQFHPMKSYWLEARIRTEMVRSISSTSKQRLGSSSIIWINSESLINHSTSSKLNTRVINNVI